MPTYKNTGTSRIVLKNGTIINPNESVQIFENFVSLPSGITKTSELPIWNPVIISSLNSGDSGSDTVSIPSTVNGKNVERFKVDIYCSSGRVKIKFNNSSFSPDLTLDSGEGYEAIIDQRQIESIIISYQLTDSSCKVDVQWS